MNLQPKQDQIGRYYRNLGYTSEHSTAQPKFMLGRNLVDATERLCRIAKLWQFQVEHNKDGKPVWGRLLPIARAIAAGETVYPMPASDEFEDERTYPSLVRMLQAILPPVIEIQPADIELYDRGMARLKKTEKVKKKIAHDAIEMANFTALMADEQPMGGMLHEALEAYSKYLTKEYQDSGAISDTGKTYVWQLTSLTQLLPNISLSDLDLTELDNLLGIIRNRPQKPDGKPYAAKSCKHLMRLFNLFFSWLDMSNQFAWQMPPKYHRLSRRIKRLESDHNRSTTIPTYTVEQLETLYQYGTTLERAILLLGLNCAMGADQSGRLQFKHIRFSSEGKRGRIRFRRFKRDVEGRWILWDATEKLLAYLKKNRSGMASGHVLVSSRGKSLYERSKNGNRSRQIPSAWTRLTDRVQVEYPNFPKLGFNSLRDTSINFVRQIGGEELASVHSAHTHQSADKQLRCYSNPTYKRLAVVLRKLEKKMQPLWDAVPDSTVERKRVMVKKKQKQQG